MKMKKKRMKNMMKKIMMKKMKVKVMKMKTKKRKKKRMKINITMMLMRETIAMMSNKLTCNSYKKI